MQRGAATPQLLPVQQHTLLRAVQAVGIGLHSAREAQLTLLPAPENTGIVFRRSDLDPAVEIPATIGSVSDSTRATTLSQGASSGKQSLSTVEHLLAALSGMAIDNAIVQLDGPEVPIMDGSAEPFVQLIESAGRQPQSVARRFLRIQREVGVSAGDKTAHFYPHDGFRVTFTVDFEQPVFETLGVHSVFDYTPARFAALSRARTFGFVHELEAMQQQGLVRGGSLDNAVLLDEHRVLNEEGLRGRDELVEHKIIDAIGDLALAGFPLIGEYRAYKAGHSLNHAALRALLDAPEAWELVTFDAENPPPGGYRSTVS